MRVSPIKKWCICVISVMSVVKQSHSSNTSHTNTPLDTSTGKRSGIPLFRRLEAA